MSNEETDPNGRVNPRQVHVPESHASGRAGWLRAAILGADDGLVSTASLLVGVAATTQSSTRLAAIGVAALVAGAMSMAAGEWVSVSSQRDTERADIATERNELERDPDGERDELVNIYRSRGLDDDLAIKVATALTKQNALETHLRDELGLAPQHRARPFQAAATSALAFALGSVIPTVAALLAPARLRIALIAAITIVALALLGIIGSHLAGSAKRRGAVRVIVGGSAAMIVTWAIGRALNATGM